MPTITDVMTGAVIGAVKKATRFDRKESQSVTKEEILSEMDADTVQLMAAMPNGMMDKVWKALGVEDGEERREE